MSRCGMEAELVKKWLGRLTRLNPASGRGQCRGKAPHQPLLLLCLIDMAEAGELPGRTFTRTANLVAGAACDAGVPDPGFRSRLILPRPT